MLKQLLFKGGSWLDVATWNSGDVPTFSDDVIIPIGITVSIGSNPGIYECSFLDVSGTIQFQIAKIFYFSNSTLFPLIISLKLPFS